VQLGGQIYEDPLLAPDNQELAFDMLRHFARHRSILGRGRILVWGIIFVLVSVIQHAAGVTEQVPSIMIVVGLVLVAVWGGRFYVEDMNRKQLKKREEEAMDFARRDPAAV
jgi:hypothetical protein